MPISLSLEQLFDRQPDRSLSGENGLPVCKDFGNGDCTVDPDVDKSSGFTSQQQEVRFIRLNCTVVSWGTEHPLHPVTERN